MTTDFAELWIQARNKSDTKYALCHTREERIKYRPFFTLGMALWRRFRYFFTFTIPILSKHVRVKTFWGETIYCSVYDLFVLKRDGFIGGEEMLYTNYLIHTLGEDDVFFDVGANMGWYTALVARLGSQVHAFEPTENTFSLLEKNNRNKPNVVLVKKAVWNKSGPLEFYDFGARNDVSNAAKDSIHNEFLYKTHYNGVAKTITCDAISLDDYCREKKIYPTFVNLDIEGSEMKVLEGMTEMLHGGHRPKIAVEFWKEMTTNGKGKEIIDFLEPYGYTTHIMTNDWKIEPYRLEPTDKGIITILFLPKVHTGS